MAEQPKQFPQEVFNIFDRYIHGFIDRRDFLESVSKFATVGMTATAILEAFMPNRLAMAQQIAKDDKRIVGEYATLPSTRGHGSMRGYMARPANATGKLPGIIVIHGGQGLYGHFEDLSRRFALLNFVAFAPDAISSLGGHPGTQEGGQALMNKLDPAKRTEDFIAAVHFLRTHPSTTGKIGVVGFCWGGGMANTLAVRVPELAAVVSFYGAQPAAADIAKIKAPLMLQYAGLDDRVNAGWPAYEAGLKAGEKNHVMHMYEGAQHNFLNDTDGPRHNKAAAELAWQRTVAFFEKFLR